MHDIRALRETPELYEKAWAAKGRSGAAAEALALDARVRQELELYNRLLPGKALPVAVATAIFALAHLPNPVLTPITLIWGAISCLLFLRYRNIYALGLAHGILGLCVAITVPNALHRHMRVGLGYLQYYRHHRPDRPVSHPIQRSHNDQSVSTEAWVTAEAPTRRS